MKIGLFDSGIGGLNVLSELIKKYHGNIYYYYGDTKNVPYGEKNKEILLLLSKNIIHFFEDKKVDLIIIACGTISANCYLDLKKITNIPIIDIISPTIDYINSLKLDKLLVFATKRTIDSHIFKTNCQKEVVEVSTPEFVPMIENRNIDPLVIKSYLANYQDINALILGCTHYPLLIDYFKNYLPSTVEIINMGKCLVNKINLPSGNKQEIHLFFSKIDDTLRENIDFILKEDYTLTEV